MKRPGSWSCGPNVNVALALPLSSRARYNLPVLSAPSTCSNKLILAQSSWEPSGTLNPTMTTPTCPARSIVKRRGPSCSGSAVSIDGIL